jgi:molecular chaperone IbpA
MRIDFAPLARSTVGFDRMVRLLQQTGTVEQADGYPPYNIEKTSEDAYRITLAVAGFTADTLTIVSQENSLVVTGKPAGQHDGQQGGEFLHRGLALRAFERRFNLADFIKVTSARIDNGLLLIDLVREVPEALKPRTIAITTSAVSTGKAPQVEAANSAVELQPKAA